MRAVLLLLSFIYFAFGYNIQKPLVNIFSFPSIHSCGVLGDVLNLTYLEIMPDPPVRGMSLNVKLNGTLSEDIVKGSKAHVKAKLGFIQLVDQDFDLCDQIKNVGEECPLRKGPISVDKNFDIPQELPPVIMISF